MLGCSTGRSLSATRVTQPPDSGAGLASTVHHLQRELDLEKRIRELERERDDERRAKDREERRQENIQRIFLDWLAKH